MADAFSESTTSVVVSDGSALTSPGTSTAASPGASDDEGAGSSGDEGTRGGGTDLENDSDDYGAGGFDSSGSACSLPASLAVRPPAAATPGHIAPCSVPAPSHGRGRGATVLGNPAAAAAAAAPLYALGVFGEYAVGKTSLLRRFTNNTFALETTTTVGADFQMLALRVAGRDARLQLWDTAGQERYHAISDAIVRRVQGALIVFALDARASFECAESWVEKLRAYDGALPLVLVGNKLDRVDAAYAAAAAVVGAPAAAAPRAVSAAEARAFAARRGIAYFETSARTAHAVTAAFEALVLRVAEHTATLARHAHTIDAAAASACAGQTVQIGTGVGSGGGGMAEWPIGLVAGEAGAASVPKRRCCA